jgi:hypothetical protein
LVVLFTVLGPLFGVMPLLLSLALSGEASANLDLFGLFVAGAYFLGTLPAALTGLLVPLVVGSLPHRHRGAVWAQVLVASTIALAVSWLLFTTLTPFSAEILAALGAFSGLACMIVGIAFRVGPNSSFKPTPLRGSA